MGTQLDMALKIAWSFHGTFYSWGGDDPSAFDCSGFVMEILQSVGIVGSKEDLSADALYKLLAPECTVEFPYKGCLAFRKGEGTSVMVHVGFMLDTEFVMHSAGGGSHIKTKEDAIEANAFIKVRPVWSNAFYVDPFKYRS